VPLDAGAIPDSFVLVNAKRLFKGKEVCCSAATTAVCPKSCAPSFSEKLRLTMIGSGGTIALNVMSKHTFGASTLLGQVAYTIASHRENID